MENSQWGEGSMTLSLLVTAETTSLILCPELGPLVQEGGWYTADGSVKDFYNGLLGAKLLGSQECIMTIFKYCS